MTGKDKNSDDEPRSKYGVFGGIEFVDQLRDQKDDTSNE